MLYNEISEPCLEKYFFIINSSSQRDDCSYSHTALKRITLNVTQAAQKKKNWLFWLRTCDWKKKKKNILFYAKWTPL